MHPLGSHLHALRALPLLRLPHARDGGEVRAGTLGHSSSSCYSCNDWWTAAIAIDPACPDSRGAHAASTNAASGSLIASPVPAAQGPRRPDAAGPALQAARGPRLAAVRGAAAGPGEPHPAG